MNVAERPFNQHIGLTLLDVDGSPGVGLMPADRVSDSVQAEGLRTSL
jgi:hypothetical protein